MSPPRRRSSNPWGEDGSALWCGLCRRLVGIPRDLKHREALKAAHVAIYHDSTPVPNQPEALA